MVKIGKLKKQCFGGKAVGVSTLGQRKGASLMKRPQGPIEIPPSVQNPQEGRSRSPKVTFLREIKKEEGRGGDNKMGQSEPAEATWL